jgi:uncharacterized protein
VGSDTREVALLWSIDDPPGAELTLVRSDGDRLEARGAALGSDPEPYRLEYDLFTDGGFVTSRLLARASGAGWERTLDLRREPTGTWSCTGSSKGGLGSPEAGGDPSMFAEALDCDIAYSPLTNAMPVLRHGLHRSGGPFDFVMAWVSVPHLSVVRSEQRYTHIRRDGARSVVRYESRGGAFRADLELDADGFVERYPGLARRIVPRGPRSQIGSARP